MAKRKRTIINPNAITQAEQEFIKEGAGISVVEKVEQTVMKSLSKSRNISANDEQWEMIDEYLSKNPQEGKRSTFIMRVVLNYIMEKGNK
jgi:hypothetical protein